MFLWDSRFEFKLGLRVHRGYRHLDAWLLHAFAELALGLAFNDDDKDDGELASDLRDATIMMVQILITVVVQ